MIYQICTCLGGNVRCSSRPCPQVTCSHPQFDGCCKLCKGCSKDGYNYRDGQTFPDTDNPCNQCTCQLGSIRCERKTCHSVTCKHPDRNGCCPDCRNCEIDGLSLVNGQRFINKDDPCEQCICEFGTVTCQRRPCTDTVSCSDPGLDFCGCPTCDACTFKGISVSNTNSINDPDDPCRECICQVISLCVGGSSDLYAPVVSQDLLTSGINIWLLPQV
ncbi:kielin/chordin-like protein [Plakobranchus ocellatus]|uniref:Kielin/chordin-like protein n=1 Tax=Plakobranchus ocellatus TaxID=259542 RepID=A0AAV3YUN9_9GAST|nr:kielin/chordin-like protein [Plakobranchus ocellatus]